MNRGSFTRYNLVGAILGIIAIVIIGWVIRLLTGPEIAIILNEKEIHEQTKKMVYPERGNIYDRWGHLLAGNTEVYEVGVSLDYDLDEETILATLSDVLDLTTTEYNNMRAVLYPSQPYDTRKVRFLTLAQFVPPDKVQRIQEISDQLNRQAAKASTSLIGKKKQSSPTLRGLQFTPMLKRSYPEGDLASNIIGFYNYRNLLEANGNFGVEGYYNEMLGGKPYAITVQNDPNRIQEVPSIPAGASLILTIDRDIQAMAEDVLDKSLENNGAEGGTIIIMDPKTGEILAMAVQPRMDLNEYWNYGEVYNRGDASLPFNRAIGTTYEPGSVFKVLTMAAGLDSGVITPDSTMLDTGVFWIGGVPIRNWDRSAHGPVTMTECMRYSLNVCLSWVANEMGPSRFYEYMRRFGIGQYTRIDMDGEGNFPLAVPGDNNWYEVNLGTNSFGQGVAVTPIQILTAINSVANRGKMVAPHVVRSIIMDGEERNIYPTVIERPIRPESAEALTEMLATSIEEEGNKPGIEGYRIAGKTGTAEIPSPNGYVSNVTNASFVGWGPVDDPRFIIYVWFEKPTSDIWGSTVAAPVFKEVLSRLVVLMDIPPDSFQQQIANQP